MKVLQINCVYSHGSTGKIVYNLHKSYLSRGIVSTVIYGRGSFINDSGVFKVSTEFGGKLRTLFSKWSGNLYGQWAPSTNVIFRYIKKQKPDIVHLHCINGYFCNIYELLKFLAINRISTVITHHAEFFFTGNCGYAYDCDNWLDGCYHCPNVRKAISSYNPLAPRLNWKNMQNAFSYFSDNIHHVCVSGWLKNRAICSPFFKTHKISVIHNGVKCENEPDYYLPSLDLSIYEGYKIVLHVTPYFEDENKGGAWVLALAKRFINDKVIFIIAGKHKCVYEESNLFFIGELKSQRQLFGLYQKADVTLLTSKRETFSMVCAESLYNGTRVVGFESGGPESIAIQEFSMFVPHGDIDALETVMRETLKTNVDKEAIRRVAVRKYSSERMADEYIQIYKSMIQG